MEAWMHYDQMLYDVFQQLCAYPFPFGAESMDRLAERSDDDLRQLSWGRLRDQAVSVFGVFEYLRGQYMALYNSAEHEGMTPYLDAQLTQTAHALRRIQVQQRRLRALLDEAPQPRQEGRN
jgi:hypothetical protein